MTAASIDMRELSAPATPVGPTERIASLDVLRGVAVLGILLMNVVAFGLPLGAYNDPTVAGGSEGMSLAAWITTNMLFEGTFRTIFSLLFGAGVILFTTRAEHRCQSVRAADLYFRRNMWLIAFGVVHAYLLLWIGEILYAYGVTALFLFVFRNVEARKLLLLGLLVLSVLVPKRVFHARELEETQLKYMAAVVAYEDGEVLTQSHMDAFAAWRKIETLYKPTPQDIQQEIELHQSDYLTNLAGLAPINVAVQGEWYYRWNFWDVLGVMLIGMALLKLNVLTAQRSALLYATMALIGYAVGIAINAWETKSIIDSQFDLMVFDENTLTYDLGRLAVAAGHVGLVMLACKLQWVTWLRRSLAAVGRMALTNYIMQTVICGTLFSGFGWGLYGQLSRYQLYYVVFGIWLLQCVTSPLWLNFFQFGPLEWIWRCLTYWQIQPVLRAARPEPVVAPEASA